jgi:hypothetical protein
MMDLDTMTATLFSRRTASAIVLTLFAAIAAVVPIPAAATSSVDGNPEAVRIVAQGASVEEVLSKLTASFDVHVRKSIELSRPVNGTYEGPLRRVVSRLLEGYSFVLTMAGERIEIVVIGPGTAPGAPATQGVPTMTAHGTPAAGTTAEAEKPAAAATPAASAENSANVLPAMGPPPAASDQAQVARLLRTPVQIQLSGPSSTTPLCDVSTGCIWSFLSLARGCCEAC